MQHLPTVFNRFRWVFCQLEVLQTCLPQNVKKVLRELPKSLDETYERVLAGIGMANRHQAHRLLQCLTVATRPLRVEELAEILALDFGECKDGIPVLNKDWRWDDQQQAVLSTCSSLIVIVNDCTSNRRVVQFAHFSVKEFLTSARLADLKPENSHFHISLEPAHTIMAQTCLGILLPPDNSSNEIDKVNNRSPLAGYAAQYWVVHAQFENVSLRVEDGIRHLFDPAKPYFAAWLELYDIDKMWTSLMHDNSTPSLFPISSSPFSSLDEDACASLCLYYASFCGFFNITKHLIAKDPRYVNDRVGVNKSPLAAALYNRRIQVAELLLQHGAVLDIIYYQGRTLLHAASEDGFMDVAQWLLNMGASATAQRDDDRTPLHLAARNGHLELVRTLLGHSGDVNAAARDGHTPLHEASAGGHLNIVRLLIRHGADANKDLQRLLLLASGSTSAETVQFFIKLGADVNTQDQSHSTPLHRAASTWKNAETVKLLIEHGADVYAQDRGHSTPLHLAASTWKNTETVKLLIEHGAYVHSQDQSHKTPLHWAAWSDDNAATVKLLIEHGADVHAQDQSHSTPLHLAAALRWNAESVKLLIEHGSDVNTCNGTHSTPLHIAISHEEPEAYVVHLLLEHGANVSVEDDEGQTPFQIASLSGHHTIARLLSDDLSDSFQCIIECSSPIVEPLVPLFH